VRSESEKGYRLYVVELDERRAVYVGYSALPPSSRMLKHLLGGSTSSGRVRRRGVRVRPDLAPRSIFHTRAEAKRAERALAHQLRRRGYEVHGACRDCPL
jgi:hypothetical protein